MLYVSLVWCCAKFMQQCMDEFVDLIRKSDTNKSLARIDCRQDSKVVIRLKNKFSIMDPGRVDARCYCLQDAWLHSPMAFQTESEASMLPRRYS